MSLRLLVLYLFIVWSAIGLALACAALKPVARTVDDAATILCELFAAEHRDLVALSPEDFCRVHRNLQPFIDRALAAEQAAGAAALQQP